MPLLSSLLVCAAVLLGSSAIADETSTQSALEKRLARIEALQAEYSQTSDQLSDPQTGALWINRQGQFRVETKAPWQQVLLSDGTDFWNYDVDLMQVTITTLESDSLQFPILLFAEGGASLSDDFMVSTYEFENLEVFVLEPRTPQYFQSLQLTFAGEHPETIAILDTMGQRTEFKLHEVVVNEPLPAELFTLEPDVGVDIIDQRVKTPEG